MAYFGELASSFLKIKQKGPLIKITTSESYHITNEQHIALVLKSLDDYDTGDAKNKYQRHGFATLTMPELLPKQKHPPRELGLVRSTSPFASKSAPVVPRRVARVAPLSPPDLTFCNGIMMSIYEPSSNDIKSPEKINSLTVQSLHEPFQTYSIADCFCDQGPLDLQLI
jgi:hypothetical protein